ncbi:hypothetical protein Lal_00010791 [Lupinus albus]|nr:hypothetical protein Lal_00010791 [Lupinus albus]
MQKNKLQEFTQKYGLQLPEYRIVNEGFSHAPKFRSMVLVNGKEFKSRKTYTHRKDAEKDVAELALKSITQDIKNEKSTILPDLVYSKSILIEYAVKKNIENPQYKTTTEGVQHHVFSSTLKFNGKSYIGEVGKRKKEAEQLVAFAAIKSLLGSNPCFDLLQIVKSKTKISRNSTRTRVNHSSRNHSHSSLIMKPGFSKDTVDTQHPTSIPGYKNKRKLDNVNLRKKTLHGKMVSFNL